jgi:hypothetical protein
MMEGRGLEETWVLRRRLVLMGGLADARSRLALVAGLTTRLAQSDSA